ATYPLSLHDALPIWRGILQVDDAFGRNRARLVERASLDHDELAGHVARGVKPAAAGAAEMPGHAAAGLTGIGVCRGRAFEEQLIAVDADDRRMPGTRGFLAVLAAALRDEQCRPGQAIADCPAKAPARQFLSLANSAHQAWRSTSIFLVS